MTNQDRLLGLVQQWEARAAMVHGLAMEAFTARHYDSERCLMDERRIICRMLFELKDALIAARAAPETKDEAAKGEVMP